MVATDGDSVMGKGRHVIRRSEMELRRKSGVGLGIIREGRGTPGNSGVELGRSWVELAWSWRSRARVGRGWNGL